MRQECRGNAHGLRAERLVNARPLSQKPPCCTSNARNSGIRLGSSGVNQYRFIQQCLHFRPLPQGHGSFRPILRQRSTWRSASLRLHESQMHTRKVDCPLCGSTKVRRSYRKGLVDRLLSLIMIYPFRCRLCTFRFHRMQVAVPPVISQPHPHS